MENLPNNDGNDLAPSFLWLSMDSDTVLKAIGRYEVSNSNSYPIEQAKMFHNILLNLMARDPQLVPEIHTRMKDVKSKLKDNCYSPVVDCFRKLYEDVKSRDATVHRMLLQSPGIETILKLRAEAWRTPLERLSYTDLPYLEYAQVVLSQEVNNKPLGGYFFQLGTDIIDVFKDRAAPPCMDDEKVSVIFAICKSLVMFLEGHFERDQIVQLRKIFCKYQAFRRPTPESLSQVAKRARLESLLSSDN